jgi:Leucine-rich repeat (LRR) protein
MSVNFESLPAEMVCQILKRIENPSGIATISSSIGPITSSADLARYHFKRFEGQLEIFGTIRGRISPQASVLEMQKALYDHLNEELNVLQLDSKALGLKKGNLESYKEAERIIKAKNFCLFFKSILKQVPAVFNGMGAALLTSLNSVLDSDLRNPKNILDIEENCFEVLYALNADLTQVTTLDLQNTRITRVEQEHIGNFPNLITIKNPEPYQLIARERKMYLTVLALRLVAAVACSSVAVYEHWNAEEASWTQGFLNVGIAAFGGWMLPHLFQ